MFCCWTPSRLRRSSELNSCWKLIKFLVPDESVKHWVKERYLTVDWIVRDSFKKCSHWILIALISGAFQFFEATSFHRRLLISDWRILRYTQASNEETLTSCERRRTQSLMWLNQSAVSVWTYEGVFVFMCNQSCRSETTTADELHAARWCFIGPQIRQLSRSGPISDLDLSVRLISAVSQTNCVCKQQLFYFDRAEAGRLPVLLSDTNIWIHPRMTSSCTWRTSAWWETKGRIYHSQHLNSVWNHDNKEKGSIDINIMF